MSATPKRKLIREAVKAMLLGQTDAGQAVYSNRVSALWKSELPSVSVYLNEETSTPRDLRQSAYIRTATMNIQIIAEAKEDLDEVLDTIADQIEAVVEADKSLQGTVSGCTLTGIEADFNTEASVPVGTLVLTYSLTYIK